MGATLTANDVRKAVAKLKTQPIEIDNRLWIHSSNVVALRSGYIGSMFGVNFMAGDFVCGTPEWQKEFERRIQC